MVSFIHAATNLARTVPPTRICQLMVAGASVEFLFRRWIIRLNLSDRVDDPVNTWIDYPQTLAISAVVLKLFDNEKIGRFAFVICMGVPLILKTISIFGKDDQTTKIARTSDHTIRIATKLLNLFFASHYVTSYRQDLYFTLPLLFFALKDIINTARYAQPTQHLSFHRWNQFVKY